MARCRRNVDNFLEACRKIGVDEELICSCVDVVSSPSSTNEQDVNDNSPCKLPNASAVLKTVAALIAKVEKPTTTATINKSKKFKNQQQFRQLYISEEELNQEIEGDKQKQELKRKQQLTETATGTKQQIVAHNDIVQLKSILKKKNEHSCVSNSVHMLHTRNINENNNEQLNIGCELMNCEEKEEEVTNDYENVVCVANSSMLLLNTSVNNNNKYNNNTNDLTFHQLINEKHFSEDNNQELSLRVNNMQQMSTDVLDGAQEYKLLQIYNKSDEKATQVALNKPLVSKRIEFFEHSVVNGNNKETLTINSNNNTTLIGVHKTNFASNDSLQQQQQEQQQQQQQLH